MFSLFKRGKGSARGHTEHGSGHTPAGAGSCGGGGHSHSGGSDEEDRTQPGVPTASHREPAASGSAPDVADNRHTHA